MNISHHLKLNDKFNFSFTEKSIVYVIIFILLPIIDMLNGYGVAIGYLTEGGLASPSQIARSFLLALLLYLVNKYKINAYKLIIFAPLLFTEIISGIILQNAFGVSYGVVTIYKLLYVMLTGIVLSFLIRETAGIRNLSHFIQINLIIIATAIYFSSLTGLGNSTYGWGFGTKSFFASGNGLSVYLGVTCLTLMALKHYGIYRNFGVISNLYIAFAVALIGTKASLLLCFLILMIILFSFKNKYLFTTIAFFSLLFSYNFIVENLSIIFDVIYARAENSENIMKYIASGRSDYVSDAIDVFMAHNSNIYRLPFGSGAFLSFQNPNSDLQFDTLETDIFDLLFMYGIYGVLIYSFIIMYIAYLLRFHLFMLFIFMLLFAHSILAGHVLFNGMSSVVLSVIFCISKYLEFTRNPTMKSKRI